eukprot:5785465-Amphidinium_carterae.1
MGFGINGVAAKNRQNTQLYNIVPKSTYTKRTDCSQIRPNFHDPMNGNPISRSLNVTCPFLRARQAVLVAPLPRGGPPCREGTSDHQYHQNEGKTESSKSFGAHPNSGKMNKI